MKYIVYKHYGCNYPARSRYTYSGSSYCNVRQESTLHPIPPTALHYKE